MGGKAQPAAKAKSRIVIEFEGPGSANVARLDFVNVSPGQVFAWAKIAELQAQAIFVQVQMAEQQKQRPQIVVPRGAVPPVPPA